VAELPSDGRNWRRAHARCRPFPKEGPRTSHGMPPDRRPRVPGNGGALCAFGGAGVDHGGELGRKIGN
jgi:hypothetical protein